MMSSKPILAVLLVFLVVVVLLAQIGVVTAQNSAIYIRADGTVEGTDKIHRDGNVYTFTEDVSIDVSGVDGISVEKDNIVVDGAGYRLEGLSEGTGIALFSRSNVTVKNLAGFVWLANSSNCIISGNNCSIRMDDSFNNSITGNNITAGVTFGIMITESYNNRIYGNYIANNENGIGLISSENNTITENTIANNTLDGIGLWGSTNNTIIRNNFINNTRQAGGGDSIPNIWDNGSEGNYWSDHTDGSAYQIESFIMDDGAIKFDYDHHPLTEQVIIPEFPSWIILPLFLIISLFLIVAKRHLHKAKVS